jgi:hypothetical protein
MMGFGWEERCQFHISYNKKISEHRLKRRGFKKRAS